MRHCHGRSICFPNVRIMFHLLLRFPYKLEINLAFGAASMRRPAPDDDLDDDAWFTANPKRPWRLRPCRPGEEGDLTGWWALVPYVRWVPGAAVPPRHLPPGCWRGDGHELLRAWYEWV